MEFYNFIKWVLPKPKFTKVDATYVLSLKGSPRMINVKRQLTDNPLTRITYIVENPGYRKVNKPLPRQNSEADVAFSHYVACKHALKNNFRKVFVLEDDFIFEKELLEHENLSEIIDNFLHPKVDHYFLGCTPFIAVPSSWDFVHWKVIYGGCTHAVLHTLSGLEKTVNSYETNPEEIYGIDLHIFANNNCYMHYQPLITQTFPETENKITAWGKGDIGKDITSWMIAKMGLDTKTRPGFDYIYFFAKCIIIILLLVIVALIIFIRWLYRLCSKIASKK